MSPNPLARGVDVRPADEWHEDLGPKLWWSFPVEEEPYCGSPLDESWPGSGAYSHFSDIPLPHCPGLANCPRCERRESLLITRSHGGPVELCCSHCRYYASGSSESHAVELWNSLVPDEPPTPGPAEPAEDFSIGGNSDLESIRRTYGVEAYIGKLVRYTGGRLPELGVIVGVSPSGQQHLAVLRPDGKIRFFHPTWELEYLPMQALDAVGGAL